MPVVSHSWKASLPIRCVGTWPEKMTSGTLSISASVMPVTALVAPGPEVTMHHADLAGRAGVALGRVHRAAFLADQDVADVVLLKQLVVDRQDGAAGIAEYIRDALIDERLDENLRTGHFFVRHCLLLLGVSVPRARRGGRPIHQNSPAEAGSIDMPGT